MTPKWNKAFVLNEKKQGTEVDKMELWEVSEVMKPTCIPQIRRQNITSQRNSKFVENVSMTVGESNIKSSSCVLYGVPFGQLWLFISSLPAMHKGTMVKTQWYDDTMMKTRWYGDENTMVQISPSYHRVFIIVPSWHRVLVIVPSYFSPSYHRVFTIVSSCFNQLTIVPSCLHHRTIGT